VNYSDYNKHRLSAQNRKDALGNPIEFKLTYEEWLDIWASSGFAHLRGRKRGQYVMSRHNDIGNYEVGNGLILFPINHLSAANPVQLILSGLLLSLPYAVHL